MAFLLDTSAVNCICDGVARADDFWPFYITDLVLLELSRTRDPARRTDLLAVLTGRLGPGGILRSEGSASRDDVECQWGLDDSYHEDPLPLGRPFPLILRAIGSSHTQHWRDAFIAQAALTNDLTLVTADRAQARAARQFGAAVGFLSHRA